jgi:WD40 repeat protein
MYTLYHQLARGERNLKVRDLEPDGILVLDEDGEGIAKFKLSPDGQVYYWELLGGKDNLAFIYGPHKNFGEVSFPDWGTSTDGSWSFYYLQVRPSRRSFAANVNLAKPDERFSGGALVKEKCRE